MRGKKLWMLGILTVLLSCATFRSQAQEAPTFSTADNEVVFLLDTSNSMNSQDKDRKAIDGIRQMMYSMPTGSRMGLVAYSTGIQAAVPLTENTDHLETQLSEIKYNGYTNAGEGLAQAEALFSENADTAKYIIMLSDGEIIMKEEEETLHSREMFSQAAALAKEKGIEVYIIAIGSELKEGMHIFDAAEVTDGAIYWQGASGTITEIADRILTQRMALPVKSAGTMEGEKGAFHIELPGGAADRVRIVMTGNGSLENVTADYHAKDGRIITGQQFAVIELERPAGETVEIAFESAQASGVNARLMTEYQAGLKVSADYRRRETASPVDADEEQPPVYEHYADLAITMNDTVTGSNIWEEGYYDGQKISFCVNGIQDTGTIQNGTLQYTLRADGLDSIKVTADTSNLYERFYITQPAVIDVEIPPDPVPEPEPDYRPLFMVVGILVLLLVLILVIWMHKRRTTMIYVAQPANMGAVPGDTSGGRHKYETKTCEYTGKLNLYVIQTESGRDIAPQTFRLFGRKSGRMTLDWILNACKVKLGKIGSEEIIFYPGPDKSVIVMDQSERCTVMRGMEILKKGMGYPVFFNEKLTITFEDGITEMEIHYKNLKPNEREGGI